MSCNLRYRVQKKERTSRPYIIGNKSFPLPVFIWRDIYAAENIDVLRKYYKPGNKNYRIIDTETGEEK